MSKVFSTPISIETDTTPAKSGTRSARRRTSKHGILILTLMGLCGYSVAGWGSADRPQRPANWERGLPRSTLARRLTPNTTICMQFSQPMD